MRVLLLNAAVMPNEGIYTLQAISKTTFKTALQEARATDNLKSYIGYPETARLIEQLAGIEVEISREQAELTHGDVMLVMRLRHRVANPASKDKLELSIDDFDFYQCNWTPLNEGDT